MLNEDNVEKLRHSLDPIERILRDIMSTDHYVTIEDMRALQKNISIHNSNTGEQSQ